MIIRVQAPNGDYVGFGGLWEARDSAGSVYRLSERDIHRAEVLAFEIVKGPNCLDSVPPP